MKIKDEEYTDKSLMPIGKHKGKTMANVPDHHLLWLYVQPWIVTYPKLKRYIKNNLDSLDKRHQ